MADLPEQHADLVRHIATIIPPPRGCACMVGDGEPCLYCVETVGDVFAALAELGADPVRAVDRWRKVAHDLATALQANVPDPYPEGAAGVALAAYEAAVIDPRSEPVKSLERHHPARIARIDGDGCAE